MFVLFILNLMLFSYLTVIKHSSATTKFESILTNNSKHSTCWNTVQSSINYASVCSIIFISYIHNGQVVFTN